jgi:DNA-binding Lrp family transcriptional regulator
MTEVAYLLVALDRNTPAAVATEIRKIGGVVDAYTTMGDFDIIARVELNGTKEFPAVEQQVKRLEGVSKVVTCVVVNP